MLPKKNPTHGRKSITLRDVIAHIQAMKGEVLQKIGNLEKRMDGLEKRMDGLEKRMGGMEERMGGMEKRLTQRIEALDEDLTATMKDTLRIREPFDYAQGDTPLLCELQWAGILSAVDFGGEDKVVLC